MMSYAFDRYLPQGMTWRDLFDVVIVSARKPDFFSQESPLFEVATEEGLLKPSTGTLKIGMAYLGGSARQVERHLGLSGDEILYVGDHMFGDVWVSKSVLRWRTALILRGLEAEVCQLRVDVQRKRAGYGPQSAVPEETLQGQVNGLRSRLEDLDHKIGPLARASQLLANPTWGVLMRAGNDKSHLAFQVERYADIYTSRVSNFLQATPYVYLRSPRGSLPHDPA
jgi:hypothetical protein